MNSDCLGAYSQCTQLHVCWMELQTLCRCWSNEKAKSKPQQNALVCVVPFGSQICKANTSEHVLVPSNINVSTTVNKSFMSKKGTQWEFGTPVINFQLCLFFSPKFYLYSLWFLPACLYNAWKRQFSFGVVSSSASVSNLPELYKYAVQRSVDLGRVGQEASVKTSYILYTVAYGWVENISLGDFVLPEPDAVIWKEKWHCSQCNLPLNVCMSLTYRERIIWHMLRSFLLCFLWEISAQLKILRSYNVTAALRF